MLKSFIKGFFLFFQSKLLLRRKVIIEEKVSIRKASFSKHTRICKNSVINFSTFGSHSYVGWNSKLVNVSVGAYTSIGPYVEVIYGTHPLHFVSTSPVFYSTKKQCGTTFVTKNKYKELSNAAGSVYSVVIGNDVWIGYGAKIIEGITIGHGAVVLAGAYVTKDVAPYSIVGGVPAKLIRYRFPELTRQALLKSEWWKKDPNWIKENGQAFLDVEAFLELIEKEP